MMMESSVIKNLYFIDKNNKVIPATHNILENAFKLKYSNKLIFKNSNIEREVKEVTKNSILIDQYFDFEIFLGFLLDGSPIFDHCAYDLAINSYGKIISLEDIPGGSFVFALAGEICYRPIFCVNRDLHFVYNIGCVYKRYIVNMKNASNISRFITSGENFNIKAVPILKNNFREIVFMATRNISKGEILIFK